MKVIQIKRQSFTFQTGLIVVLVILLFIGGIYLGSTNASKSHFDDERALIKKQRDSLEAVIVQNRQLDQQSAARFDSIARIRDIEFQQKLTEINSSIRNLTQTRNEELRSIYSNDSIYLRILARKDQ
jgi:hypothetical protein